MILEAVDHLYIVGQIAGKSFGLLNRFDAGIQHEVRGDAPVAVFSGQVPGWSAFELVLPADAEFFEAGSGVLERWGMWYTYLPASQARQFLERALAGTSTRVKPDDRHRVDRWRIRQSEGGKVEVAFFAKNGRGMISVRQTRPRSVLKEAMRQSMRAMSGG